jgi:3-oxoacyl-[acyl-carrier-protein] synthase III
MPTYSAIITGTGSFLPEKRLTNDDLSKMVDTNDQWIVQRTGISERRIAGPDESTATLGTHAAKRAIAAAGLEAKDIDMVVCATITPEMAFPSTACFIAAALGMNSTPAFDVTAACSGFMYALEVGAAFIQSGRYRNVLVIGSETLSRVTDYQDRGTCILFGDGAGAVVLQRTTETGRGIIYSSIHADGNGWDYIYLPPGSRHPVDNEMLASRNNFMKLKGREVYKWAVHRFEEMMEDALRKTELTPDQIALVVPHQSNLRIIESATEKLKFPRDRVFVNIDRCGNTSAASIPIALDEAMRGGRIKSGDAVVLVAFGAGLTWSNAVIRF